MFNIIGYFLERDFIYQALPFSPLPTGRPVDTSALVTVECAKQLVHRRVSGRRFGTRIALLCIGRVLVENPEGADSLRTGAPGSCFFFFCDLLTMRERCVAASTRCLRGGMGANKPRAVGLGARGAAVAGKGRREGARKNRVVARKPAGGKPNNRRRRRRTDRPAGNGARRTHTYTRQRRRRRRQRRTTAVCQSVVRVPLPCLDVICFPSCSDRVTSSSSSYINACAVRACAR